MAFLSVSDLDLVDRERAKRIRRDYGLVGWLVSWYHQDHDGLWVARVSCPTYDDTVEGVGVSRCKAIDAATRALLAILHQEWKEVAG